MKPPLKLSDISNVTRPHVTTVITCFNHQDFLAEAIESALGQKGDFVHTILIADDASTDGTRKIVEDYCRRFPSQIKDISPTGNLGISGNMRRAFELVQDDYVAILEGDDYWADEHKLEKQLCFLLRNGDCSMVFSRIRILKQDGTYILLDRHEGLPDKIGLNDLCYHDEEINPICNFSCCLFKTSLLRELPDITYEHRLSEITVAFHMAKFGWIGYIPECLSVYRFHDHNVFQSASRISQLDQAVKTFSTACRVADAVARPRLANKTSELQRALSLEKVRAGQGIAVSIVTICYNNLEGLKVTAESVLKLRDTRHEWIVIDGGSTDGSAEYIRSTLAPHLSFWCSEPDGGIYEALNKGTEHAHGEYVIAMNSGDAFATSTTLQDMLAHDLNADVIYGDWIRRYPDRDVFNAAPKVLEPFYFLRLDLPNISHQAMLVRTQLLRDSPYDCSYRVFSDYAKWRQFMMEGRTFQYVPETVCIFKSGGVSDVWSHSCDSDLVRIKVQNDGWGRHEIERFVEIREDRDRVIAALTKTRIELDIELGRVKSSFGFLVEKTIRGIVKAFIPYGLMRHWLAEKYGLTLDEPLNYYPGVVKRLKRVVKFMLPCGLVPHFWYYLKENVACEDGAGGFYKDGSAL